MEALIDELAHVLATPGEEALFATVAVARDLVIAAGRPLPEDGPDPDGRPSGAHARRQLPAKWTGHPLPRPAMTTPRIYQRVWDADWGFQMVVRSSAPDGRPTGAAKPLWLRRHRAGEDPHWRRRYDIRDEWDVPDSNALQRLALDLINDAVDEERNSGFHSWNQAPYIARHFAGDVIERQLRDTAWTLTRDEILRWLALHGYLQPVT